MHRPLKQGDLVLDLDPIFYTSANSNIPTSSDPLYTDEKEDTLSISQTTTKRTTSTRENALKIKDILEGNFPLKGFVPETISPEKQIPIPHQYQTLDHKNNISIDYTDNNCNNSVDLTRTLKRVNSANSIGYKSKGTNSSFIAAYHSDIKTKTPQRNTVKDTGNRKSITNLDRFNPVHRVQRPHSTVGYRQYQPLNRNPSMSPETKMLDESIIEREYGTRIETAPDSNYLSENTKKTLADRKEKVNYFKKQGVQKYENKVLRQELERQMKMLENRVKRLAHEEQNITKNIRRTGEVMNKAITNKQRFQDEIAQSEAVKIRKIQEQQRAREKIKEEKTKRENSIKSRVALIQNQKMITANQVKVVLQQDAKKVNADMRKEEEKKQKIYQATVEFEKLLKLKKKFKQVEDRWHVDENHIKFLQEEHMKTLEIENKIQELAKKEERMLDQIKATQHIHAKAEVMMKKVLSTKVEKTRQQLEFR